MSGGNFEMFIANFTGSLQSEPLTLWEGRGLLLVSV